MNACAATLLDSDALWFLAATVAFITVTIFTLVFLASQYTKCPPDKVMVVTRPSGPASPEGMRIVRRGGTIVFPMIEAAFLLDRSPVTVPLGREGQADTHLPPSVTLALNAESDEAVRAAATTLGSRDPAALRGMLEAMVREAAHQAAGEGGSPGGNFLPVLRAKLEHIGYTVL